MAFFAISLAKALSAEQNALVEGATYLTEGRAYTIVNVGTNTVIDLSGSDNYTIFGWERNDGSNQRWIASRLNNGWIFRNQRNPHLYLALEQSFPTPGNRLVSSTRPVIWTIAPSTHGIGNFTVKCSSNPNLVLDMFGNSKYSGTQVVLWNSHGGSNQAWRFD